MPPKSRSKKSRLTTDPDADPVTADGTSEAVEITSTDILDILWTSVCDNYLEALKTHYSTTPSLDGAIAYYMLTFQNLSMLQKLGIQSIPASVFATEAGTTQYLQHPLPTSILQALQTIAAALNPLIVASRNRAAPSPPSINSNSSSSSTNQPADTADNGDVSSCLVPLDVKRLTFKDVVGQIPAKDKIMDVLLRPLIYPRIYKKKQKGLLMYGPPGTGKTLLASAIPNELAHAALNLSLQDAMPLYLRMIMLAPQAGDIKGKYHGESEKNLRNIFKCAEHYAKTCEEVWTDEYGNKSRIRVMCIVFIDEIDALLPSRGTSTDEANQSIVTTFLQLVGGVVDLENVIIIAATNYPWRIDSAALRRFETKVFITTPTAAEIVNQIKLEIGKYITHQISLSTPVPTKPKPSSSSSARPSRSSTPTLPSDDEDGDIARPPSRVGGKGVGNKDGHKKHRASKNTADTKSRPAAPAFCGPFPGAPHTALDVSAAATSPLDVFNLYRTKLFPGQLTDETLSRFASDLAEKYYSGSEISNLCLAVFQAMGRRAVYSNFDRRTLPDPENGSKDIVDCYGNAYIFNVASETGAEPSADPADAEAHEEAPNFPDP
jgi:SpoVK/Ycf46/Vps4 family AAA+-type ATPase